MVICIHVHIHTYCGKKVTVVCLDNKLVIKEILKIMKSTLKVRNPHAVFMTCRYINMHKQTARL